MTDQANLAEPRTLYDALLRKFLRLKFSYAVADDLAERAADVAKDWPDPEIARLRRLLFRVALVVTDPDRDHVDRCVDVMVIVGSAEDWRSG